MINQLILLLKFYRADVQRNILLIKWFVILFNVSVSYLLVECACLLSDNIVPKATQHFLLACFLLLFKRLLLVSKLNDELNTERKINTYLCNPEKYEKNIPDLLENASKEIQHMYIACVLINSTEER